jgi:ATP-binding cassette, subfamily B, bacterial
MVLCRSLADLVKEAQSRVVTDHVSDLIHAKSVEVDLAYYENPAYHDSLFRAQEEAPWRPTSIVSGFMQLGQNTITFLGREKGTHQELLRTGGQYATLFNMQEESYR